MKILNLLLLLVVMLFLSSCGEDDIPMICTQGNWTGTYTGTQVCDGVSEPATIKVNPNGSININFEITDSNGGSLQTANFPIIGCDFSVTGEDMGITVTTAADLDGNNIEITITLTAGDETSVCVYSGSRI